MLDPSLAHLVSWAETTRGDIPPPLTGPSITVSPLSPPTVFLFGGKYVQSRRLSSELWALDLATRTWSKVDAGPGPSPRYFHSMDTWHDQLVCFGGMSDAEPMTVHNDVWYLDCKVRRWARAPDSEEQDRALVPSPRYAHLSAVSRGQLLVIGGQHTDNSWIYEINAYDLARRVWVSKTHQPELAGQHTKGAYRSVACSSPLKCVRLGAVQGKTVSQVYSVEEEGQGGDIWMYSNYDFAKVRREIDLLSPSETPSASNTVTPPPFYSASDQSFRVTSSPQPPGLRFPVGGIVGDHLILCGLYLATSSAAFSVWALNLETMMWRHLEPNVLRTGSWNRAVLWPQEGKLLVFGKADQDLAADYTKRTVNLDQVAVVSLESYGIYCPPKLEVPVSTQSQGLSVLDEKIVSDFEVICDDGRKIKCSRRILAERWPWFKEQEAKLASDSAQVLQDHATVDINDTLLGSLKPTAIKADSLTLPEPFAVCVALVQYFYTLSLSTPLQNRATILSALLFLAKQFNITRLASLAVHALHQRLEPNTAVGIYELATLCGEQNLQVRALSMIHTSRGGPSHSHPRDGSVSQPNDSGRTQGPAPPNTASSRDTANGTSSASYGQSGASIPGPSHVLAARPESPLMPPQLEPEPEEIGDLFNALYIPALHDETDFRAAFPSASVTSGGHPSAARASETSAWRFGRELWLNDSAPPYSAASIPMASARPSSSGSSLRSVPMPLTPSEPARETFGPRDAQPRHPSPSKWSPGFRSLGTLPEARAAEEPDSSVDLGKHRVLSSGHKLGSPIRTGYFQQRTAPPAAMAVEVAESADSDSVRRMPAISRKPSTAPSTASLASTAGSSDMGQPPRPRVADDAKSTKSLLSSSMVSSELSWSDKRQLKKEQKKADKALKDEMKRAEKERLEQHYKAIYEKNRRMEAMAMAEQQRQDEIAVAEGRPKPLRRTAAEQALVNMRGGGMVYGSMTYIL